MSFEVPEPIINSPFEEPARHWYIRQGEPPELREGRRPSLVFQPRDQTSPWEVSGSVLSPVVEYERAYELVLVNLVRERVKAWRTAGYPGVTRTSLELLQWWRREGRERPLFFAQLEAAETIVFLAEARADFLQGIEVPRDEPGEGKRADGYAGFLRYACKMATGSGKTTVMGMLAAWSILNKVNNRSDKRFSDVVLVVCPNVTIRDRLRELSPEEGEASLYRTRDLVPSHLMPLLSRGRVIITNWHVFEPQSVQEGGVSAKVVKAGVPVRTRETITIGAKTTTARGRRYLTAKELDRQVAVGMLTVLKEHTDRQGNVTKVEVESVRYVESDTALVARVLGREVGGKQNILVMNDEAHHAYRIRRDEPDENEGDALPDEEDADEFFKEATIWVDGLDRIDKLRGINRCIDLSATPYYLGRMGQDTARPFPWVVSDFGLIDAIESGLVKVPQLAVRDTTGAEVPGYFNIWHWIMERLTSSERGGKSGSPKPEAILKWAHAPIAMLGALWAEETEEWAKADAEAGRPAGGPKPVFIIVCKNTKIAKLIHEWLADDICPAGIPPMKVAGFRNRDGEVNTIRVDSKVIHETDTDGGKVNEARWMRFTLDTVGKMHWPSDRQGRSIYPTGFEELARKLERPLHPPGRDVRCIVSVGMLTEGWDANTVTHIVGLRPFMSQLLCEQVVGRGLRRVSYDVDEKGYFSEEVATVFGVPFDVIPFKASKGAPVPPPVRRNHVHAIPAKASYEIRFPRVEGYTQPVRNNVIVDWSTVAPLVIDPTSIPTSVEVKPLTIDHRGRPALAGPGRASELTLTPYRARTRIQEIAFDLARDLTRYCLSRDGLRMPSQELFPRLLGVVQYYLRERVDVRKPGELRDISLSPYYGMAIERLAAAIGLGAGDGEAAEVPRYESSRGEGSTGDVDFWTSREVREVNRSHLNFVVADTKKWEQSTAYLIDHHTAVDAFVKNAGFGFAIPYLHDSETHDYIPDFIIRLTGEPSVHLILETKGYDPKAEIKRAAAERWARAVTADGRYGEWRYAMARSVSEVVEILDAVRGEPAVARKVR